MLNYKDNKMNDIVENVSPDMSEETKKKFSILEDLLEQGFSEETIIDYDLVNVQFLGGHIPLSCPLPTKVMGVL